MEKGLQYKRTDRAIVNAFIKLVNQGSFEKLTVQEILDEALVSRNTFYSHYRDKYDIAEQLFEKYKEDLSQNENQWLQNPDNILTELPTTLVKTFDEQMLFVKKGGGTVMHGDPHMGNLFVYSGNSLLCY